MSALDKQVPNFQHNSQTILYQFADAQRVLRDPSSNFAEYWEFLCAGLITKEFSLSDDQLTDGIVGAGADGGIDLIYTLVDGNLVDDTFDPTGIRKGVNVHLILAQAKTEKSFSEDTLNKLQAATRDLLSLSIKESDFSDVYNEEVRRAFHIFRTTYRSILTYLPSLKISYYYAANRAPNDISSGLTHRADALRQSCLEKFEDADVTVNLLGARELWALASDRPRETYTLNVERFASGKKGYLCLVKISEINKFLRNDNGDINQTIFDSNVRYHLSTTPVNNGIAKSLSEHDDIDFWWLNNGITILGSSIVMSDDTLTITDPQIVNGLQTSIEIAQYFDGDHDPAEARSVLLKTISVSEDDVRYKIIRATNNQNPVSAAMLRATDHFQRSLEAFLFQKGVFYERRKGFWSSQGKPISSIFSLIFIAQSVMATLLERPDNARARPSDPLSKEEEYKKIFSDKIPVDVYYKTASLARYIELFLKKSKSLKAKEVNNLRFYILMYSLWVIGEKTSLNAEEISKLDIENNKDSIIEEAYRIVNEEYIKLGGDDDVAKGTKLTTVLRKQFDENLGRSDTLI